MVFSTSRFDSFSIRPPTPPKDIKDADSDIDEVLQFIEDPFGTKPALPKVVTHKSLLNTPDQSPSSETAGSSVSERRRKKVNFELQTCTLPSSGLIAQSWTPRDSSPLRPLPQTRVSRPLRSILKAYEPAPTPSPAEGAAAHNFETFADMLESVVKMLAQGSRPSKLDAYISIQRTMQAYDKVPDIESLKDKMGLLLQFIHRDIQAASPTGTGPDSQLITQALKFLMALVRIPELKPCMDDDFCSFVVDHIIYIATGATAPKTIINTHLALLMQQSFRRQTMTPTRVEKILDMLENIQQRVSGFSVHAYRIRVYKKLIQQRPDVMAKHTERWFKHTIKAMLSAQKDINQSALDTAICAAKTFSTERAVTKSVLAVLNRVRSDGDSFAKLVAKELDKMLASENATLAPQIWGAVTALLRGCLQIHMFPGMKDWLSILEKFFASSNDTVKLHANVAFNVLIYAVSITHDTSESWSRMFVGIAQHQVQQRSHWKRSESSAATSGYFTLLYYALRPDASAEQLDRYWNEFVADFWRPMVNHPSTKHSIAACRVVSGVLGGSRRLWHEQRALEMKPPLPINRGELPLLDPKWVRKSLSTVLPFVEHLIESTRWTPDVGENEPVKAMWTALLDSLMEASSKEIIASSETKDAIAHIVNLLHRMWERHTAKLAVAQQKEDCWADNFCSLIDTVIQKLGALKFNDKCLTRNANDEFEVAPTPSHRSRQPGPRLSPLLYFVELLVCRSEGKLSDHIRLRVVRLIVEPCLHVQNSRLAKLDLLKDCCVAVEAALQTSLASSFWNQVATWTMDCMQDQPPESSEHHARHLGKEYDVLVEILVLGSPHLLSLPSGQELLTISADIVRQEAGDGAVVLALIEKVSECVLYKTLEAQSIACLPYLNILLKNLPANINRRLLEQSRQKMWPSSPSLSRGHDFDPYNHFYASIATKGAGAYHALGAESLETIREFLHAFAASIKACPISLLAIYLRRTQSCTTLWIDDPDEKMQGQDHIAKQLYEEVSKLWRTVMEAIARLPRKDSSSLLALEPLVTAGFSSRRRGIVNLTVALWNKTFGQEDNLRYPSRLEEVLQRLRLKVDLSLPSLAAGDDIVEPPSFYDSDDGEIAEPTVPWPRIRESPVRIPHSTHKLHTTSPALSSTTRKLPPSRQFPKVRLRHENSQIQFEPINSSPNNPFVQESQILTERQQEMVDRQRSAANIFSEFRHSNSPQTSHLSRLQEPLEFHSDELSVDELPMEKSRTPLKTLSLAPMDVFLGSSPTPHARNRSQQILSDETSVATPTAVRTVQLVNEETEFGSSPPRCEKQMESYGDKLMRNETSEDFVSDSFVHDQSEGQGLLPSERSNVNGETALGFETNTSFQDSQANDADDDVPTMDRSCDLPSSTVELQLTAQLNADMEARIESRDSHADQEQAVIQQNLHEVKREATSPLLIEKSTCPFVFTESGHDVSQDGDHNAIQETPIAQSEMDIMESISADLVDPASAGRIGKSSMGQMTYAQANTDNASGAVTLRRSSRVSNGATETSLSASKKRKGSPSSNKGISKKSRKDFAEAVPTFIEASLPVEPTATPDSGDKLDCIEVIPSSLKKGGRGRPPTIQSKRESRSRSKSQAHAHSDVAIPETTRKRSFNQSLLPGEDATRAIMAQDGPAPKRAKQWQYQDVSDAEPTRLNIAQPSQPKRLSHVQISPRTSSSVRGSSTVPDDEMQTLADQGSSQKLRQRISNVHEDAAVPAENEARSQQEVGVATLPNRSFTERIIATPRSILESLKSLKNMMLEIPHMVLGQQEEHEYQGILTQMMMQVHDAGGRREGGV